MPADVPGVVTDTAVQRWSRRRFLGGMASVAALGSFAAACGGPHPVASTLPGAPAGGAGGGRTPPAAPGGVDAELISRGSPALAPSAPPPPPPAVKPITLSASN